MLEGFGKKIEVVKNFLLVAVVFIYLFIFFFHPFFSHPPISTRVPEALQVSFLFYCG